MGLANAQIRKEEDGVFARERRGNKCLTETRRKKSRRIEIKIEIKTKKGHKHKKTDTK